MSEHIQPVARSGAHYVSVTILSCVATLVVVFIVWAAVFVTRGGGGTGLSTSDRDQIARANCSQLSALATRYAPDADSVPTANTAVQLISARLRELRCPGRFTFPWIDAVTAVRAVRRPSNVCWVEEG